MNTHEHLMFAIDDLSLQLSRTDEWYSKENVRRAILDLVNALLETIGEAEKDLS